jgi:hypothetical protein
MPGLDRVLQGLRPGDNVVWEVERIEDYLPVLNPFAIEAGRQRHRLIYFCFANHPPLLGEQCGAEIHRLDPEQGFETFLTGILQTIEKAGPGAYYIFDCLSDLAADWFSDRMLGNFFLITCPYLYQLETIAYFALLKNEHSVHATEAISQTAQVVLEVFRKNSRLFIQPHKVYERHSPTMYMLHSWEGPEFRPVTSSATITEILSTVPHPWLDFTIHRPGVWTRAFRRAQQVLDDLRAGKPVEHEAQELFHRLVKMVLTRDERLVALAERYFELADLVEIMKRMIGSGLIGGKSFGMLLARAVLRRLHPSWSDLLEDHDSFYIGSDAFYTYLVQNGCWWLRRREKDFELLLERAAQAREKMLQGTFSQYIQDQFMEMLEYFGQSPIIVRSSSLLEDNYGNAFSGKYESVFCANQGAPEQRLQAFMTAVRTVYASTMSEEGLRYRLQHGLLDRDEQMALLVQRVSGEMYGKLFFPHVGGVGFSFNPFAWHEDIDPNAGVLRMVFGLGTRAVERTGDDYSRLVALNAPQKRLETTPADLRQYSQHKVDVLDLQANELLTRDFETVAQVCPRPMLDLLATADEPGAGRRLSPSQDGYSGILTFDRLLAETDFAAIMRQMLHGLHEAYSYPVDIEFTTNFLSDGRFRVNLVQCRPFQVKIRGEGSRVKLPARVDSERLVLASRGPIVGQSLATAVDRLIYIVPAVYSRMTMTQRYSVARTIGRIIHLEEAAAYRTTVLVGPGRWGTSMPSLGVPVTFAEISRAAVLCELALMHEGLLPDVSLGTHFFNDLVELDMLYLAVSPGKDGHVLDEGLLRCHPNRLPQLIPSAAEWANAIWVIDPAHLGPPRALYLNVDSVKQRALCYWEAAGPTAGASGTF